MSTNNPADDKSTVQRPTAPRIERGRFRRAVIEDLGVEREADRLYRVEHGGCTCPDFEYRGEYACKHVTRAALVEAFANTVSSEFVARVVRFAREQDCPCGGFQCDGPAGPRLPCPGCIDAVRFEGVDEWTVWLVAVTEGRR